MNNDKPVLGVILIIAIEILLFKVNVWHAFGSCNVKKAHIFIFLIPAHAELPPLSTPSVRAQQSICGDDGPTLTIQTIFQIPWFKAEFALGVACSTI